jgi:ABC-2 type transport system ATP-binding protein
VRGEAITHDCSGFAVAFPPLACRQKAGYSYVPAMIEAHKLSKYFGERAAIRDLNFTIAGGEVVGLLGLNGAGKTTTLRVLASLLLPTSGTVTVDGVDVTADPHAIRRKIGFLPDQPPLYPEMTVGAYLGFAARLRQVPARETAARVAEAEAKTALDGMHREIIGELSHGFRQRVGLAQAIVHKPALLILDEPTAGLDPAQIVEMRALLRGLRGAHTVLISSHFLTEISQTCDRLLVMHKGELVGQGSEAELAADLGQGGHALEAEVRGQPAAVAARVEDLTGVTQVRLRAGSEGTTVLVVTATRDVRADVARTLVTAGCDLLRLETQASANLESIFMAMTGRTTGEAQ